MKSWKLKILLPVIFITLLILTKFILWDFPVSSGKRVGNLTKISEKGRILKTWEGTIDEGSGDKLTSNFSVKDDKLAEELYNYEGKQVIIYYDEYLMGWPRDTKYVVKAWKSKNEMATETSYESSQVSGDSAVISALSQTLFCSLLGSLYKDRELYQKVKEFIKKENLYIYKQYAKCNE